MILGLCVIIGASYMRALSAPGYATFADTTSAWLRDHGGGDLVDHVEAWWYSRHKPSRTPADLRQFATDARPQNGSATPRIGVPTLPRPVGSAVSPTWHAAAVTTDGGPVVYVSAFEPDPALPSVVAGVAVIDQRSTHTHFVTGLAEPGHTRTRGEVPPVDIPHLAATFNSGFRFADISGGVMAGGHVLRQMRTGQATAAIDAHGHMTVGQWGRDVGTTTPLVAARQNLDLIVDRGRALPAPGHSSDRWGGTHLQYQYTWRSGLGVDRAGNLIYLAGNHLDLQALATGLVVAGAVRAMELDMHSGMTSFSSWQHIGGQATPTRLLSGMNGPERRYLEPDRRDFFYLTTP
ncbi:hypothetical protein [Williamsia serinedens]|uniref:Phosphodiester glycosidase domain-containing protein n=1 Tax=Williamsia serinedens TaxID=391736 RepID=A0ABT1H020_9NOCA|nr:hypothetical protein [Williamsia serinedens]MCP2160594.1 hypothetical protein [Williamsia serinedens]